MPPSKTGSRKGASHQSLHSNSASARSRQKVEPNAARKSSQEPVVPESQPDNPEPSSPRADEQEPIQDTNTESQREEEKDEQKVEDDEPEKQDDAPEFDPTWKPQEIPPQDFDAKEFLASVSSLKAKLKSDSLRDFDSDYDGEELVAMVQAVTTVMENMKTFNKHTLGLLEDVRDQIRDIKDRGYKKIQAQPYDHKSEERMSVEERQLEAEHQKLNRELAKVSQELVRATQLCLDTEEAATHSSLMAQRAADEAERIQHEYETRRQAEKEARLAEEERQRAEELRKQEEERAREEVRAAEEARRNRLRKHTAGEDGDSKPPVWANWPVFNFNVGSSSVGCLVRGNPDSFRESSVQCRVVDTRHAGLENDGSEELVSNVIRLSNPHGHDDDDDEHQPLSGVQVAIPHNMSRQSYMNREPVIKARYAHTGCWTQLQSVETTFDGHKDMKFVQAEASDYGDFAVVTRFKKDFLVFHKRGGKVSSSIDARVSFHANKGTFSKNEHFVLQLQAMDSATVGEVRLRSPGLLTTTAIVSMEWTSKEFDGPVTMTLPCPPNPVKAKKAAAARAAKEAKMKQPDPAHGGPADEDKDARRTRKRKELQQKQQEAQSELEETEAKAAPPTKWYMGQYGGHDDDENDILFFLRKSPAGKWLIDESLQIQQVRLDLLQFDLVEPIPRFMVLRTRTNVDATEAQTLAEVIETRLSQKVVLSVLKQRSDDFCDAVLDLMPVAKSAKMIQELEDEGYEQGPGVSKEIALCEGDLIEVHFRGNIKKFIGEDEPEDETDEVISFVYNSQMSNRINFSVVEVDKFLQKSYMEYRGFVQLYRVERVKGRRASRWEEAPEETRRHLIAEHQLSIPKELEAPRVVSHVPVTLRTSDDAVNEDTLRMLASQLGDEWQKLAHYLNVRKIRLQAILRNATVNSSSEEDAKYEMLLTWLKKLPRGFNKVESLRNALIWSSRDDLAHELQRIDQEHHAHKQEHHSHKHVRVEQPAEGPGSRRGSRQSRHEAVALES